MFAVSSVPVHSGRYARPLPIARSGWRRRIEVFSPKLGRRLSLGSYDAYRTWLVIEANPAIEDFTERPARVEGRSSALIDYWVRLRSHAEGEFWLLERSRAVNPEEEGHEGEEEPSPTILHGLPVRCVRRADLHAWAVPIANWSYMVAQLASHRRFRDPLLEQKIADYLGRERMLDQVLAEFSDRDGTGVEAALFALVAAGRVLSADLAVTALSGATRFRRL